MAKSVKPKILKYIISTTRSAVPMGIPRLRLLIGLSQVATMDYFTSLVKVLAIAYIAALVLLYFIQPSLIYYPELPSRKLQSTPQAIGLSYEDISLTTKDQIKLHAWYIPNIKDDKPEKVLLFFHGNAGNISHRLDSINIFFQMGLSVFILDYRGYGNSEGKTSEKGTYMDADAAMEYLTRQRNIDLSNIIVFGRSLGGAVAAYVAERYKVSALVLESTFTSATDMASRVVPWPIFPARLMSRYKYNTAKRIPHIACPVLVVHSRDDEIIPFSHGETLYQLAKEQKQFLPIRGGHNDGFILSGDSYHHGLRQFLNSQN